jgi:hypothetical protein
MADAGDEVTDPAPGDIILTRGSAWTSKMIRLGAALLDRPNAYNHVVVFTHWDALGIPQGIEARAEGAGDIDLRRTLKSRWLTSNADQPKTPQQRAAVVEAVKGIKGTRYDWGAIFVEGLEALRITPFWTLEERPKDRLPTSLICSALADWAYAKAGLPNPGGDAKTRLTTPADWAEFVLTKHWEMP